MLDGGRGLFPHPVRKLGIRADGYNLDIELLELLIFLRNCEDLRWSDKGKIGRIKTENPVFALIV